MKKAKVIVLSIVGAVLLAGVVVACVVLTQKSKVAYESDNKLFGEEIDWSNYQTFDLTLSQSVTITAAGVYHLTGQLADGMVMVDTRDNVKLILDNVKITNSRGSAILVKNAKNTVIAIQGENRLEDAKTYADNPDDVGVIFSHDDLILEGDGKLEVIANAEDGVVSKDNLKVLGGTYEIETADDGLRGKDAVIIQNGTIKITAGGDGIKSTNDSDDKKGYILVENGNIEISATSQALQAAQDLTIKGGQVNITKSNEGLEGKNVTIEDGKVTIVSSDDGINAADKSATTPMRGRFGQSGAVDSGIAINILGGEITVDAAGDGLDSNGNIYISGGETIVYGPTDNGNSAIDYEGECAITGGTVLAGGASGMAQGFSTNSSVYSVEIGLGNNNQKVSEVVIETESAEKLLTYRSGKSYNSLIVASPSFTKGASYKIKLDGNNYEEFTITDIITKVGEMSGGGFGRLDGMPNGNMPERPSGEGFRGERPGMKNPPEKPEA